MLFAQKQISPLLPIKTLPELFETGALLYTLFSVKKHCFNRVDAFDQSIQIIQNHLVGFIAGDAEFP